MKEKRRRLHFRTINTKRIRADKQSKKNVIDVIPAANSRSIPCSELSSGSFKTSYVCKNLNKYTLFDKKGKEVYVGSEFVVYYPRDNYDISGFNIAIKNLASVSEYHYEIKEFFMVPEDDIIIKDTNTNLQYESVIVPVLYPMTERDGFKFLQRIYSYIETLIKLLEGGEINIKDLYSKYLPTDVKPDNVMKTVDDDIVFIDLEFYDPNINRGVITTPLFSGNAGNITSKDINVFLPQIINLFTLLCVNTHVTLTSNLAPKWNLLSSILFPSYDTITKYSSYYNRLIILVEKLKLAAEDSKRILEELRIKKYYDKVEKRVLELIRDEKDITGSFDKLLFVHATPFTTFLDMIRNRSLYVRCCLNPDDPNNLNIVGKGAQFRYGLDSQYGDVMFVFKGNNWWKQLKGSTADPSSAQRTDNPFFASLFKGPTDLEYQGVNKSVIDSQLEREAQFTTFRNTGGSGEECINGGVLPSWCNLQMHLSENVLFDNVKAILIPAYLKNDLSGNVDPNFENDWNTIRDKFVYYGENLNEATFYSYMDPDLLSMYRAAYPSISLTTSNITRRNPIPLSSTSRISISDAAYLSAQKKYFEFLVEEGCVTNNVNILTYNVWWRALLDPISTKNISNIIRIRLYDFICLQEAADHTKLGIPATEMKFISGTNPGSKNTVVTYYNAIKYKLENSVVDAINYERDRPILFCKFGMANRSRKIFVVNIHNSHTQVQIDVGSQLKQQGWEYDKNTDIIIFAGDFNSANPLIDKDFTSYNTLPTCCNPGNVSAVYDHIYIKGKAEIVNTRQEVPFAPASDHFPVSATIRLT